MPDTTLSQIHTYPVKSLRGFGSDTARVEPRGLAHDRRWMVVDGDGVFLTQREHPEMARVTTRVTDDALELNADGAGGVSVPLGNAGAETLTVRVWRSVCEAQAVSSDADRWLSDFLGRHARLVFMPDATRRQVNPDFAAHAGEDVVSFADGYPLLLVGESSLDALNARLGDPLPMDRFRPNLVVSGASAFAEDGWARVRVGNVLFHVVKPCDRCAVTTVNQQTGARGTEPLRTLAQFRRRDGKVLFGQYLIPDAPGTVCTGDTVEAVTRQS